MISLRDAIVSARLAGRHGRQRVDTLEMLAEEGMFDASELRQLNQAFDEGVEGLRSGYACQCQNCLNLTDEMREKERRRWEFAGRRYEELRSAGKDDDREIERIIAAEIAAGAAQQQGAVVVRTSKARTT